MEFKIIEVAPEYSRRTELGRVVVNPPTVTDLVEQRETGKLIMCCGRAFLTELSYKSHRETKEDHGRPVPIYHLPSYQLAIQKMGRAIHSRDSREFWMTRKRGIVKKDLESDDEIPNLKREVYETEKLGRVGKHNFVSCSVNDLDKSRPTSGRGRWVKCPICNLGSMYCNMERHMRTCHSNGKFKCMHCPCTFLHDSSRKAHQNKMHPKIPGATFKKQSIIARAKMQLVNSKSSHPVLNLGKYVRGKVYKCTMCEKTFPGARRLSDHINTHTGARPYRCDICGFRFSHFSNVVRHKRNSHTKTKDSNSKFFCNICNCNFSNLHAYSRHTKVMHPKKLKIKRLNSPGKEVRPTGILHMEDIPLPSLRPQHPSQNSAGFYECHVCQKQLRSPTSWRGHMLIHQNLKPHKCDLCGNYFRLNSTLAQHKRQAHTDGNFSCKDCTCRFNESRALLRHKIIYHSKKLKKPSYQSNTQPQRYVTELPQPKYKCSICERVLPSLEDYKKHELVHSNLKPSQCDLCLKDFAQKVGIINHKKRAHKNGPYKCSFCCCRYNVTQALFTHLVREHAIMREDWNFKLKSLKPEAIKRLQQQLLEPSTTDDQSSGIGSMINGITEPNNQSIEQTIDFPEYVSTGAWQCNVCPQAFHSHKKLLNHKKIVHKVGKFKCPSCPFTFIRRAWLHKHELAFHGAIGKQKEQNQITSADFDKPSPSKNTFDCSTCGKVLGNDKALKCHIIIHHRGNEKEFKCGLCGLKFSTPGTVRIHKKRAHHHSGKFKCDQCSCKFLSLGGLINHQTTYHGYIGGRKSGGKPISQVVIPPPRKLTFKCRHCDKILPGKTAYRIHVLGHATAKIYECDLCHIKLLHRSSIIGHKKQCHNHDGKFQCSKCSCKFVTSRGLENHTQLYHTVRDNKPKMELVPEVGVSYDPPKQKFSNARPEDSEIESDTTQLSLECRYCHKILSSKSNLRTHLNVHTRNPGEKKHECDLCDIKFSHPGSVGKHKRIAHNRNGKFKCSDCSCKFLVERGLIWHQLNHHKSASSLNKHNVVHDSKSMIRTNDGSKGEAHNLSKKKCHLCHLWLHVNNLPTHRKNSHFHDGQFKCTKCTCKFLTSEGLRAHTSIYHKDPIKSTQIGTVPANGFIKPNMTTRRGSQTSEIFGTTGVEEALQHSPRRKREKLAECNLCNRKVNYASLVKHKAVAHSNGQYKCTQCSCCFHTVIGLTKHNDWHDPLFAKLNNTRSDTRIISSKERKKSESETSGLEETQEEDRRSNVPPRVNRNFLKIRGLAPAKRASPKKTNSPSNISSALEQNKSSTVLSSVPSSRHVTAPSSSRRRWKCNLCGITFGREKRYVKHNQTAHTDGEFKCKKCPCVFQTKLYLGAHIRTHHNALVKGIYNTFTAKAVKFRQIAGRRKTPLPINQANKRAPPLREPRVDAKSKDSQANSEENKQEELDKISGGLRNMVTRSSRRSDSTERNVVRATATAPTEPVKPANVATVKASAFPALKCSYCAKVFYGSRKLQIHILSHTRPAQCPKCLNRFRTKDEVTKHIQALHGDGAFQCYICTCRFGTNQGLKQHMTILHKAKSSNNPDSITIEHDQEEFVDSESLIQEIYEGSHTNHTHADNYFEESEPILEGYMETRYLSNGVDDDCIVESEPIVQGILTTSYTVNNEEFVDESEPQVQGIFEIETPSDITTSSLPQPVSSNRKPYTPTTRPINCTTCGITCYGPANLRLHMKSHEEESAANDIGSNNGGGKCSKCGYEFASKAEIMQHLKIEHDETGQYRCAYCPCTMKTEPALRDHFMKYHSG